MDYGDNTGVVAGASGTQAVEPARVQERPEQVRERLREPARVREPVRGAGAGAIAGAGGSGRRSPAQVAGATGAAACRRHGRERRCQ